MATLNQSDALKEKEMKSYEFLQEVTYKVDLSSKYHSDLNSYL